MLVSLSGFVLSASIDVDCGSDVMAEGLPWDEFPGVSSGLLVAAVISIILPKQYIGPCEPLSSNDLRTAWSL